MKRRHFLAGTAGIAAASVLGLPAFAQSRPDYYPAEYEDLIEQSRAEGRLLIYSAMSLDQWVGIQARFQALYPWIAVETLELGSSEVAERYLAEKGSGSATADLLATGPETWMDLHERGEIMPYESPEGAYLPEGANPYPGLYTFAVDPVLFVWNKAILPPERVPTSFADLVEKVEADPEFYRNRMTTYGADTGAYGYTLNYAFVQHHGDKAWEWLDAVGPLTRPERSSGPQVEKVTAGEYLLAFFCGSGSPWVAMRDPARAQILDWSYISDGTPMMMRSIGISNTARHSAAAKLMLDLVCSREGQIGLAEGNRTPYRPDITPADIGGAPTYSSILAEIGEENAIMVGYDPSLLTEYDAFIARWRQAYGI